MYFVANDQWGGDIGTIRKAIQPRSGRLQQRGVIDQGQELFRVGAARQGPQTGSGTTGKYHGLKLGHVRARRFLTQGGLQQAELGAANASETSTPVIARPNRSSDLEQLVEVRDSQNFAYGVIAVHQLDAFTTGPMVT